MYALGRYLEKLVAFWVGLLDEWEQSTIQYLCIQHRIHYAVKNAYCSANMERNASPHVDLYRMLWLVEDNKIIITH